MLKLADSKRLLINHCGMPLLVAQVAEILSMQARAICMGIQWGVVCYTKVWK